MVLKTRKKEKGFTLVLSLVLLLAMSLMGGALIVIASSDHRGNNSSDEYQQTFYVAETALMEGEKNLIDQIMGAVNDSGSRSSRREIPTNMPSEDKDEYEPDQTPCYKSFKNLSQESTFRYVEHKKDLSFFQLIEPIVTDPDEKTKLEQFTYEYFIVNSGTAVYKAAGSSLKKSSGMSQRMGSTYRIFGCGILGTSSNPDILIPLETILVLSH